MNIEEIVKQYGTPLFLYDGKTLNERINYLKSKLNKEYKIIYAVKASTFIIPMLDEIIDGYEICSFGEFEICNNLNLNKNKFLISGVHKDKESIENMFQYNDLVKYTIESLNQYKLLNDCCEKYNKNINVLVRLTSGNQFGISESDFYKLLELNKENKYITIKGIEYFSGTQKHSTKKINKEIDYILEFVNKVEEDFNIKIEEIEYGPGAPVFYFQDDEFDEDTYLEELNEALNKIKNRVVSLEIGRSIAASCGTYITRVVDLKDNKNGNIAILDGGINHLVYYGQSLAMRIPFYDILPNKNTEENTYTLYGSLCTINDIIVKNINVRKLDIGDIFAFKNVGAYSSTEGISLFLSRNLPKVVICDKMGVYHEVRNNLKTSDINFPNYK